MYDLLPIFRQLVDEFLKLKIRTELRKRARTYLARILGLPAWYGAVHFIASARFGESMTFWIGTTKRPRKLSTSFGLRTYRPSPSYYQALPKVCFHDTLYGISLNDTQVGAECKHASSNTRNLGERREHAWCCSSWTERHGIRLWTFENGNDILMLF